MSICLILGGTYLASKTEIELVLYYQYTVGAAAWIDKDSMYIRTSLVLLKSLYMHLISPLVDSESIAG